MCKDRYFYYQEQLCVVMEPILLVPVHQVLKYMIMDQMVTLREMPLQ